MFIIKRTFEICKPDRRFGDLPGRIRESYWCGEAFGTIVNAKQFDSVEDAQIEIDGNVSDWLQAKDVQETEGITEAIVVSMERGYNSNIQIAPFIDGV